MPTVSVLTLLLWLAMTFGVSAVGVADVELRVQLERQDGRLTLSVGEERADLPISLENLGPVDRTVRLFSSGVDVDEHGDATLGDPAGAPYLTLDQESIAVPAGESVEVIAHVDPTALPDDTDEHLAALVLEAEGNETVVVRAAQIIRVTGVRTNAPLGIIAVVAGALVLVSGGAVLRQYLAQRGPDTVAA